MQLHGHDCPIPFERLTGVEAGVIEEKLRESGIVLDV